MAKAKTKLATWLVATEESSFHVEAERLTVADGTLIFYGGDRGAAIIRAVNRDNWTSVTLLDDEP